jgi:lipoprotein-anchoring transpeptidase ErfK/SrfK
VKLLTACAAATLLALANGPRQTAARVTPPLNPAQVRALQIQVMLDRAGFSPGEIDASMGTNTRQALDAYRTSGGNTEALPQDALVDYRVTDADTAGPFTPDIPDDLVQQAQLPALGYRDVVEMLGERFHASPSLLRRLNPQTRFAAGDAIRVPNVLVGEDPTEAQPNAHASKGGADVTITVTRSTSTLTVKDQSGKVAFFAPVTTGSEHDPLPIGTWKVTGVQRDPAFHYNPDLFWDANPANSKAVIKPGPNNPVGVVWIDIDRPHYGLHGTPEPSMIGKTTSHGCVRLTNWDALVVASFARPGTAVIFAE